MEYNIIKILLENKQGLSKSSLIETLKVSEKSRKIFTEFMRGRAPFTVLRTKL